MSHEKNGKKRPFGISLHSDILETDNMLSTILNVAKSWANTPLPALTIHELTTAKTLADLCTSEKQPPTEEKNCRSAFLPYTRPVAVPKPYSRKEALFKILDTAIDALKTRDANRPLLQIPRMKVQAMIKTYRKKINCIEEEMLIDENYLQQIKDDFSGHFTVIKAFLLINSAPKTGTNQTIGKTISMAIAVLNNILLNIINEYEKTKNNNNNENQNKKARGNNTESNPSAYRNTIFYPKPVQHPITTENKTSSESQTSFSNGSSGGQG